jgi:hypothetical protein
MFLIDFDPISRQANRYRLRRSTIDSIGSIRLNMHPDAGALVDQLAIGELGEHARWLLELGAPG